MRPDDEVVKASLPPGASVRALVKPDREYLIYLRTGLSDQKEAAKPKAEFAPGELPLQVTLPAGEFRVEWLDTKRAGSLGRQRLRHSDGQTTLPNPAFAEDIALTIRKLR